MRRCKHCNEFMQLILSRDQMKYAEYCDCQESDDDHWSDKMVAF